MNFLIYHSGFVSTVTEKAYDASGKSAVASDLSGPALVRSSVSIGIPLSRVGHALPLVNVSQRTDPDRDCV